MNFLEKDLEQIIMETDNELLREKGLWIWGKKRNQLRIGNYGIADIVTLDKNKEPVEKPIITVYELKKEKIGISSFLQGIQYIKGIIQYIKHRGYDCYNYQFNLVIVGRNLDTSGSFCFLPDLISNDETGSISRVNFYTYDYTLNGIIFKEESGYKLTNNGF